MLVKNNKGQIELRACRLKGDLGYPLTLKATHTRRLFLAEFIFNANNDLT